MLQEEALDLHLRPLEKESTELAPEYGERASKRGAAPNGFYFIILY